MNQPATTTSHIALVAFKYTVGLLLSPTWLVADLAKRSAARRFGPAGRRAVVVFLNSLFLTIAAVILSVVALSQVCPIGLGSQPSAYFSITTRFLLGYLAMSRANEIFFAFLRDAFDKLHDTPISLSNLQPAQRIALSLRSYLELVGDFAIIYLMLPVAFFKLSQAPTTVASALYFSGVTITTLGYGDIAPVHWFPQLLTVYEVFCGFTLLIVCFTIYGRLTPSVQPRPQGPEPAPMPVALAQNDEAGEPHEVLVPLSVAVQASLLAILSPAQFLRFQTKVKPLGILAASDNSSAAIVFRAFWLSCFFVLISAILGAIIGWVAGWFFGSSPRAATWLQIGGASLLLWGTLFVRGWQIQTNDGQTLIEQVNQWLYRALYCIGTAAVVAGIVWS